MHPMYLVFNVAVKRLSDERKVLGPTSLQVIRLIIMH